MIAAFCYANKYSIISRFRYYCRTSLGEHQCKFFNDLKSMIDQVTKIGIRPEVALLAASNHRALDELITHRTYFSQTRVLLLLPDNNPDTASKGLLMYPRFFGSIHSDLDIVFEIFKRVIEKQSEFIGFQQSC